MHRTTTRPTTRPATMLTTLAATAAMVAGPLALAGATAHATDTTERRAAAYTVTAKANLDVVTVGEDVVKVRGKVRPRAAGTKVVLQQRLDGKKKWAATDKGKVRRNGTYLLKDRPSVSGTREYRVLKPASRGVRKGTSDVLAVEVYAWRYLTAGRPGASANVAVLEPASIGTRSYPFSIKPVEAGKPTFVEYTLGRLCTDLRTTYALDDSSETGATGAVKLVVDGVTKVDRGLVVGQVVESTTDLTDAFRVRYELTSTASPVSKPVVATPEVRCTK